LQNRMCSRLLEAMLRRPEPATKMTAAFVSLILLASALPSATGFATTARALPRLAKQRATEPAAFLFEAALADSPLASLFVGEQPTAAPAPNIVPAEIEVRKALAEADVEADADSTLWPWQVLLLGITAVSKRNTSLNRCTPAPYSPPSALLAVLGRQLCRDKICD